MRPLLGARRESLRDYLRANGQNWREDSTNRDVRRTRAHIREQLLPVIERDFSREIVGHLGELARLAREEGNFWDAFVEDRIRALARKDADGVRVAVRDVLTPLALQSAGQQNRTTRKCNEYEPLRVLTERLIRRLYEEVRGDRRELGANHVEQVMHLAERIPAAAATWNFPAELPYGEVSAN